VWKSVNGGSTFKPVFDSSPSNRSGLVTIDPKNPKVIWRAPAKRGRATAYRWVTASTSLSTAERAGPTWDEESERIARILVDPTSTIQFTSALPANSGATATNAALQNDRWWADLDQDSQGPNARLAARRSPWISKTLGRSMPACGIFRRKGWTFRSAAKDPTPLAVVVCSRARTAARRGPELDEKSVKGFRQNRGVA